MPRNRFDPASLVIIERLDRLEHLLKAKADGDDTTRELSAQDQQESPSTHGSPLSNPPHQVNFGTFTIETVLSWPVFGNRFDSRLNLKALLNEDSSTSGPTSSAASSTESFLVRELETGACSRLLDSFLKQVHPANPILDVPRLFQYLHRASVHGFGWDARSCLMVSSRHSSASWVVVLRLTSELQLLICALGSIAEAFHMQHEGESIVARHSPKFVIARSYFDASQKRIGSLLMKHGVLEAQCFFYAGVYLMTLQQPMAAWRFFVQAAATSQAFDYPRRPLSSIDDLTSPSVNHDRVAQESVYWTCLKSEL